MRIVLTTDHAGLDQVKQLIVYLQSLGHECSDFGPSALNPDDDYPDLIYPAAVAVAKGEFERGIIMGGSGQGEAIVANRVRGVRCALYYGPSKAVQAIDSEGHTAQDDYEILRLSREHNNANMLSLAARFLSQNEIEQAASIWLDAPYSGAERHERRIKKIDQQYPA